MLGAYAEMVCTWTLAPDGQAQRSWQYDCLVLCEAACIAGSEAEPDLVHQAGPGREAQRGGQHRCF